MLETLMCGEHNDFRMLLYGAFGRYAAHCMLYATGIMRKDEMHMSVP